MPRAAEWIEPRKLTQCMHPQIEGDMQGVTGEVNHQRVGVLVKRLEYSNLRCSLALAKPASHTGKNLSPRHIGFEARINAIHHPRATWCSGKSQILRSHANIGRILQNGPKLDR